MVRPGSPRLSPLGSIKEEQSLPLFGHLLAPKAKRTSSRWSRVTLLMALCASMAVLFFVHRQSSFAHSAKQHDFCSLFKAEEYRTACLAKIQLGTNGEQIGYSTIKATKLKLKMFDQQVREADGAEFDVKAAVYAHIRHGHEMLNTLLESQSTTLQQLLRQYSARNAGRRAPLLLKDWFEFAKEQGSFLTETFEQVERNVEPMRGIAPRDLRARIETVIERERPVRTGVIEVKRGMIFLHDGWGEVESLRKILAPLNGTTRLPDMRIPVNWDDMPKVLATTPREKSDNRIENKHGKGDDVWESFTQRCPSTSIALSPVSFDRPNIDVCEFAQSYGMPLRHQHGYFESPKAPIDALVPILSWARLSTQNDILAPHPCYGNAYYRSWESVKELPFVQRKGTLYWRGSSTGSQPDKATWRYGQRQRVIKMAQDSTAYIKSGQVSDELASLPTHSLRALRKLPASTFDMAFTSLVYCEHDPEACAEMKAQFPLAKPSSPKAAFMNRYLLDVDGNSMSCRFYRLLETDSLVFKSTVFSEWSDDRLIPWVHYVPLSMGMEELPILLDYFENTPLGLKQAAAIAQAGKEWAADVLQRSDLTVYYYRLLVELADLLT